MWLLFGRSDAPAAGTLAIISVLMSSGMIPPALGAMGWKPMVPYLYAGSWVPLWIGVLGAIPRGMGGQPLLRSSS
jgi:hypothetical protein